MEKKMASSTSKKKKELIYRRSEYLALRNEADGYYLCQTLQHVYATSAKFKIQWLSERPQQADTYKLDYIDHSQPECIITHVKLKKLVKDVYRLPEYQKAKIKKHLNEALRPEEDIEENENEEPEVESEEGEQEEESSPGEDEESADSDDEPVPKRRRPSPPAKSKAKGSTRPKARGRIASKAKPKNVAKKKVVATKSKLKRSSSKKAETKKSKKKAADSEKPKKRRLTPEERANPNLLLVPNPRIKVWNKDPLIYSNEKIPFVSSMAHSKLVFRAVAQNDMKLLQSLVDNVKNINKVNTPHSVGVYEDGITYAVKKENHKAIQVLFKDVFQRDHRKKPRCAAPRCLIDTVTTGKYNRASLGIRAVRKISMSRGCKEGNNALTKDIHHATAQLGLNKYFQTAASRGVSKKTIDTMQAAAGSSPTRMPGCYIRVAIQYGHRKLAAALIEEQEKRGDSTFNNLAKEVLKYDTEPLKKTGLREASVKKKSWDNENITPIHCAAINPNVKYLIALFSVLPEYGILDQKNRRPIHFAAACEGTGPLEYLLNRGVDPSEADSQGYTPLMVACRTGRVHNVELLLKHAEANLNSSEENDEDEEEDEDEGGIKQMNLNKYGVGGINRPNQRPNLEHSLCPIHFAIEADEKEVVACLIRHGVDVHKQLSAGKNKKTPLMVAACTGNLDIVKMLIKEKARVEEKDKLRRTALIHAVMNGHAHVASYLLSLGASPDQADSSGNTCCHYAAAYGWYFCLKVLIDASADPTISNDWKVSPLGIAFLKGHLGLVDYLLQQPGIDINFKDDQGMTLLALACSSSLLTGLCDEVAYLVDKKAADSTIKDVNGNTALHHLAMNDINVPGSMWNKELLKDAISQSVKIASILLRSGCSAADKNNEGFTPVMSAISQGNTDLVKLLMEKGGDFSASTNQVGQNALHLMAEGCMNSNLGPLVEILDKSIKKGSKFGGNILTQMAGAYDKEGLTPLLRACRSYNEWAGSTSTGRGDDDDEDEEDEEDESENESDEDENDEGSDDDQPTKGRKRKANKPGKSGGSAKKAKTNSADPSWEYGRKFIRVLLELCNANPSLPSHEREYKKGEKIPDKERERYLDEAQAKGTPLYYVLNATSEPSVVNSKGEVENHNPLLSILLKHLRTADVNVRKLDGSTPLLCAIAIDEAKGDDAIKKLVKFGADVNMKSFAKNEQHVTPLMMAIGRKKNVDIIKLLLTAKADVHARDRQNRNTPLHFAVSLLREEADVLSIAKALLSAGAAVNASNKKGRTPLHIAVASNTGTSDATSELETYLIESGASLWQKDNRERLPIHYTFTGIGTKYYERLKLDPIELCTTLTSYMTSRSIDVTDNKKMTPLHYAARCGASVCCTHLVQKKCDINAKDARGNTPLTLAAIHGHETCTIMLIQKNADITIEAVVIPKPSGKEEKNEKNSSEGGSDEESNAEDEESMRENHVGNDKDDDSEDESDGKINSWEWELWRKRPREIRRYPVFQVCVKNDWAGVIFLMLDMLNTSFTMNNAIEAAINTGRYNLVLTLIRKVKNNKVLQETNSLTGRTLMHTLAVKASAAQEEGQCYDIIIRVADALNERGVPLNTADRHGCRPLHYAALMHNIALVKYLVENLNSDNLLSQTDSARRTPLAAMFWICSPSTMTIYEHVQDMDDIELDEKYVYPEPPMSFGASKKKTSPQEDIEAEYLADQAGFRCTPLIRAIQLQDFNVAKMLLKEGADPNATDNRQRTPLVHAIKRNDIHLVKLLLNHNYKKPDEADIELIHYDPDEEDGASKPKFGKRPRGYKRKPFARQGSRRAFTLGRKLADSEDNDAENESDEEEVPRRDTTDINMRSYPTYKRVSAVQMNVKDDDGLTLVHHLVIPLKVGTFDNVAILKLLHDAGAPIADKDNTGLTPLDYALNHNAPTLAKALQKLMGIPLAKWAQPTLLSPSAVSDGLNWTPLTLYSNDAESLALKLEENAMDVDEEEDKPEPDEQLEMAENGEVVMDEEQEVYYDVTMTKIDVKANYGWGLYNFYIMQVVKHKAKDLWILFNRWGRIGDDGQFQRTPFGRKEDAVKEFAKIFKAKSANSWENVKRFEPKVKKYRLIEADDRRKLKKLEDVVFDLRTDVSPKLPDHLLKLMKSFTDESMLQNAYSDCGIDTDLMPFGRIKREAIVKATGILDKITPLVGDINKMKEKSPIEDIDLYKEKLEQIESLSNEIYHLVPESGYAYTAITPIDNEDVLQNQMERLTNLIQLELASTIMAGAMYRKKEINPMDYVYRSIGTTIKLMEPDEPETQYLLKYIQTGLKDDDIDNRVIEGIYEVHRPGEFQRLNKLHLNNHKLLFHGTKTANLISILHRGLLVAPPGALITGHLYGKGIYTSDTFCKSADYCYNGGSSNRDNFVLICEVALGSTHITRDTGGSESLGHNNSRLAPGEKGPQDSYNITLRDGAILPLGNLVTRKVTDGSWWMPSYSEYIVFSADQVRLRYLVQFKV